MCGWLGVSMCACVCKCVYMIVRIGVVLCVHVCVCVRCVCVPVCGVALLLSIYPCYSLFVSWNYFCHSFTHMYSKLLVVTKRQMIGLDGVCECELSW